jgi:iron-sulfur cluster repair protein YtfE (RIC family)
MAINADPGFKSCYGAGDSWLRNSNFRTVTACLEDDHRALDLILADVEGLITEGDLAVAAETFREFQRRLDRHIAAEELLLFPVFERLTGCTGPTSVMRSEHFEITRLMTEIRVLLEGEPRRDPLRLVQQLARTLGSHNVKEERVLYPKTDEGLARDARDNLVKRIELLLA